MNIAEQESDSDVFDVAAEEPARVRSTRERNFARYSLEYELASGGMATVFMARALGAAGFEKPVAIKRIHPHLAKRASFVEMFLDEARIASRIDHPNVCSVFDFGEVDGAYYLAMEYLVGESLAMLARAVARRPDLLETNAWRALAARIVMDAAEGLHAAHELVDDAGKPLSVVHRDVSPHNIMVTYEGAVKVVDFGIAVAADRLHHTATGVIKGKYAYMAPEQLRGGEVDRRTDVWALGVCLFELLTARRLFRRKTERETLLAVETAAVLPPSTLRPGVPEALDRVVLRALARDPAQRFPTARAMARELEVVVRQLGEPVGMAELSDWMERLLAREHERKAALVKTLFNRPPPLDAPPPPAPEPAVAPTKPIRRAVGIGVAAMVALGATLALGVALGSSRPAEPDVAAASRAPPLAPARAATGAAPAPTPAPDDAVVAPEILAPDPAAADPTDDLAPAPDSVATERAPAAAPPTLAPSDEVGEVAPRPARVPASPSRPRAPPRARGTGTVNVITVGGWAEIRARGRYYGRTPMQLRLPAGRHVLELRPFGEGRARRVPVTVTANETERVRVPLSP